MPSEFDLIQRHFTRPTRQTDLAQGDDAALLTCAAGMQLVVSTDMLVSGTHFFPDAEPRSLGWKTLAVNLSDLAAMGAAPRWAVLALALPEADDAWLEAFAGGLFACAERFGVDLCGGDTTRGPLTLCVTIFGETPQGKAITRDGARPGDELWVTGQPGRAALGLAHLKGDLTLAAAGLPSCLEALHRPQPRVAAGIRLRAYASAMLDVSDGLIGDLTHILKRSGVGAEIDLAALPLAPLRACGADATEAERACLGGGDDYELLFTAPSAHHAEIVALAQSLDLVMTPVGLINERSGTLLLRQPDGRLIPPAVGGYNHFG